MIDALPVEIKGQYASTLEQLNTGVRSSTPRDVLSANNLLKRLLETCERFHVQDYEGHMQRLEHEMEQAVRENSHLTGVDDDNSSKKSGGRFFPEYSLEGLMLKLKLQYFVHPIQRTDSLEKTLMLGKI